MQNKIKIGAKIKMNVIETKYTDTAKKKQNCNGHGYGSLSDVCTYRPRKIQGLRVHTGFKQLCIYCDIRSCAMNKYKYIFPLVLIGLDLCAGVVYLASGDIKKFIYWIAAAVLNITVTF